MTDSDVSAGSPAEHDGDNEFDPNTFMRARRLELYSDSEPLKRPLLSKELLEYQLDTLTSRKQEIEFEYFCRRLAEKEICPNLRPQTGPTGGGDSKVDSETVPVSSEISRIWVGFALEASKERWAFAFSAKKDWKGKARSDVASAIGTARGYKRLYFITNQFARDKARASLEDELRKRYGIDIYILDRSWILQCIFEHDRLTLAVEALRLTDLSFLTERKLGRRDAERQLDLDELEAEIADPTRYRGAQYQLAEDCFRAALLARALDKPRVEVDGYFARAERIAEEVGHPQQLLRLVYERAWTAFWWFNDVVEVNHLYDIVESKATGSLQAEDFELVVNLWQVLRASTVRGPIDAQTAKYEQRTIRLKTELDRLASDAARPNNALQARTDRLLLDLNEAITAGDHDKLNAVWDGFDKVVTDAESLGDYPFERFYKLVQAFGKIFPASGRFDQFFENVVRALERRRSEGESGVALLGRGFQKLKGDKPYDAIRLFGRAQERLFRREYREELVSSLAGAAQAYGHVGLFWAARSCALAAVERCLAFYREDGTIVRPVLPCLDLLAWQELRLGRLPRFMEVHETTTVIAPHLKLDEDRTRKLGEEMELQDLVCGLLLLKSSLRQLDMMRCLPHVLERVQLLHSRMALLYALGCQDTLQVEGYIPEGETAKSIELFFQQWLKQPANAELPNHPNLMNDEQVEFRSNLLGCDIVFAVENDGQCIYLAEALLGALEAFLATSLDLHVAPFRERARIIVKSSRSLHGSPEISVASQEGESVIVITSSAGPMIETADDRKKLRDFLLDAVIKIMGHIAVIKDERSFFEKLVAEERAFARALSFADVDTLTGNVFGAKPKLSLRDWIGRDDLKAFPLQRSRAWYEDESIRGPKSEGDTVRDVPPAYAQGPVPNEMKAKLEQLSHQDRRVRSLIDVPLWNRASWSAVLYAINPRMDPPLILGLAFKDRDAARAIFTGWRNRLGESDLSDQLRVSIIKGVSKRNPSFYNVVIGSNVLKEVTENDLQTFVTVSRINEMRPQDTRNLEGFLNVFGTIGRYSLTPVHLEGGPPVIHTDLCIEKTTVIARNAWEIGENDPDIVGIRRGDDPIIPDGVENAPVLQILKSRKKQD